MIRIGLFCLYTLVFRFPKGELSEHALFGHLIRLLTPLLLLLFVSVQDSISYLKSDKYYNYKLIAISIQIDVTKLA